MPLLPVAGVVMSIVQGGLVGPLSKKFGEKNLLKAGAILFAVSTLLTMAAGSHSHYYGVMFALCIQCVAAALVITSMQSLVSQESGDAERGMVLGVYSSAGTLGRIIGTTVTGSVCPYPQSEPLHVCRYCHLVVVYTGRSSNR